MRDSDITHKLSLRWEGRRKARSNLVRNKS
ncbi:hypothetical protein VP249E411_P0012 [Vibrio phage 249E41-1]|nr:hypothetical protein VP249E411_P0012 [Vibrio phage 249E41-1]CAH9015838.1 hypothetical protein VP193E371_P0012 [Vibrio phage 193E37-1]